jgi:hypothetical protein
VRDAEHSFVVVDRYTCHLMDDPAQKSTKFNFIEVLKLETGKCELLIPLLDRMVAILEYVLTFGYYYQLYRMVGILLVLGYVLKLGWYY